MRTCRLSRRLLQSCPKQCWSISASPPSLPFLYETSTIRNFSGASRSAAPGSRAGSRAKRDTSNGGHVPFENVEEKPRRHSRSPVVKKDGSSLSVTEREAFTKLFGRLGMSNTQHNPATKDSGKRPQRKTSRHLQQLSTEEQDAYLARLPRSLRSLARTALERITASAAGEARNTVKRDGGNAAVPSEEDADAELEKYLDGIEALLNAQDTDVGAWKVLQREVFEPLKLLNLDGKQQQPKQPKHSKVDQAKTTAPPEMVLAGVPHVALLAADHIHGRYPASQLPLSILPQLKHISKTAHALALSPDLYASILSLDWKRSSSPSNTISILQEMEAEGVELDRDVLASLSSIVQEAQVMQAGGYGPAVQLMCGMEGWADTLTELSNEWVPLVSQRIVDTAVKEAHEHEEQLLRASEAAPSREDAEDGTADVLEGK